MRTATLRSEHRAAPPLTGSRRRAAVGWAATVVIAVLVSLVAGLVFAFNDPPPRWTSTKAIDPPAATRGTITLTDDQREDLLAAAPMPTLPAAAANPHALLPRSTTEPFELPPSRGARGLVATGFPGTAAGAVAQLIAIDQAAIAGMNPAQVAEVYADWAVPSAQPLDTWSVQVFVQQTLNASGIPNGSSQLQASYTVTEAQIKGTVGDDFVLACVNGEFDASLVDNTVRTGAADCARMVWTGMRWQIGSGTEPVPPPNAWPGSADAAAVGWKPVVDA